MSAREPRRPRNDRNGGQQPSVVGSKLKDVSSTLGGRGLPKGGLREQDRLKVAEGALPDSTTVDSSDKRSLAQTVLRVVAVITGVLIVLLVSFGIALAVLSHTGAFEIASIETYDSEHLLATDVARLAGVEENVSLLNVDANQIEQNVKRNPWVASVDVEKVFPDTLRLHVHERSLGAVVAMSSGGVAWLLGDDNVWIEPLKFEIAESESVNDAALQQAESLGVILVSDVPTSVNPAAGSECTDEAISAVMSVASQLSDSFKAQVVCYSASSEDDISVILSNGVEVSMGSAGNIETKEAVATRILDEFGGQITYINVRIPSHPTYRRVDSEYVREGTGATGTAVEEKSIVPKIKALEDEESEEEDSTKNKNKDKDSNKSTSSSDSESNVDSSYGYDYDSGYDYYGYDEYGYGDVYGY